MALAAKEEGARQKRRREVGRQRQGLMWRSSSSSRGARSGAAAKAREAGISAPEGGYGQSADHAQAQAQEMDDEEQDQ